MMKGGVRLGLSLALMVAALAATGEAQASGDEKVVFVCEHGAAKSVIVLKVNIPRNDLSITVANVKTPTPFGFGGWVALTKGTGGMDVMMGDLVLTQDEVNPVMSALLDNGLDA